MFECGMMLGLYRQAAAYVSYKTMLLNLFGVRSVAFVTQ